MNVLANISDFITRPFNNISLGLFSQIYYHQGGLDKNGSNISHVCADFASHIFFYNSILSQGCRELAWSNRILDLKCMYWAWNLYLSVTSIVLFVQSRYLAEKMLRCFLSYQVQITCLRNTESSLYRARTYSWAYMEIYWACQILCCQI